MPRHLVIIVANMTSNQNQTKAESHSIPPEADHGKLAHLIAISLYDAIWPANL